MADTLPTAPASSNTTALVAPANGATSNLLGMINQPALRKALPMLLGLGGLALAAIMYMSLATGPQRILYATLNDGERASVAQALDAGGISYRIDNGTGAITVAEDQLYRARMLVASDGALANPESAAQMLDSLPIGASRTLEGERLRNVREHELTRTIMEIDGVEAVRVHLAQAERSVFVRDNAPPSASVMVRLAKGRNLSDDQVKAIVNLVAGSVPGMDPQMVRVADQRGQLLSERQMPGGEGLTLQREYEDKLRAQIAALLVPMLGDGSFSSEVQVELNMDEVTSARETYDPQGVVRAETERQSTRGSAGGVGGIPGVLANTPPVDPELVPANETDLAAPGAAQGLTDGESTAQRTYELGREVAVSTSTPGAIKRISVAVAVSSEALEKIAPATEAQLQALIASAVGAVPARGDEVTVMPGTFDVSELVEPPFYETAWFAMVVRHLVALIAVILALFMGVRPLLKAVTARLNPQAATAAGKDSESEDEAADDEDADTNKPSITYPAPENENGGSLDEAELREQISLTRDFAAKQPDRATAALRRMLASGGQA